MATNDFPWYLKLLGNHLIPCRALNLTHHGSNEGLKIPTANIFTHRSEEVEFVLGLYFTPLETACDDRINQLTQLYQSIKAENLKCKEAKRFEMILVALGWSNWHREGRRSCVDKQFQHLPWFAVPPLHKHTLERLTRKYEIKTLSPALVLLNGHTGQLITKHGLEKLATDTMGDNFPWIPQPLPRILENVELIHGGNSDNSSTVTFRSLSGLILGFYFSAHWCPPCRWFTPELLETYNQLRKRDVGFQIIFVSSDRSKDSFDMYLKGMPWLAVPYSAEDCRLELAALFGVQGIPTLVLTDSQGFVINKDGRGEINEDPKGLNFPWRQKLVNVLTDRYASRLQENPGVVFFVGAASDIADVERVLTDVAFHFQETRGKHIVTADFFIACDSNASETLRHVVGLNDSEIILSIIDLPEGVWCYRAETLPLSKQSVIEFINRYYSNELHMIRIGLR